MPIDYDALAKKHGGTSSAPPPGVDYDALAKKHGGTAAARRDSAADAFHGLIEGARETFASIPEAIAHPIDGIAQVFGQSKEQFKKAIDAAGEGHDNNGDLAGFVQHAAAGMLPIIGPMASDFIDTIGDGKTDAYEQGRRLGQIFTFHTVLPKAGAAVTPLAVAGVKAGVKAAAPVAKAVVRGVKAAAPDVAAGSAKMAAGYTLSGVVPHELQVALGIPLYKGGAQAARGLAKGYKAMRDGAPPAAAPPAAPFVPQTVDAPLPPGFVAGRPVRPPMGPPVQGSLTLRDATRPPPDVPPPGAPPGLAPAGPVRPPLGPKPTDLSPYIPNYGDLIEDTPPAPPVAEVPAPLDSAAAIASPVARAQALFDAGKKQFEDAQAPPVADPLAIERQPVADPLPIEAAPVAEPPAAPIEPQPVAPIAAEPPPTPEPTPAEALLEKAKAEHAAARDPEPAAAEPAAVAEPAAEPTPEPHPAAAANRLAAADRWTRALKDLDMQAPALDDTQAWKALAQNLGERKGYAPSAATREMIHERMGQAAAPEEVALRSRLAEMLDPPEAAPEAAPASDFEALLERSIEEARARKTPAPAAAPVVSDKAGDVANVHPSTLTADPARFQYKSNTGGAAGVGDELKGISEYDPELGGVLSVWKDPADGKTYVVNGHHRLELANRAGAPEVSVRYMKAKTAAEARLKGAVINIAEGRGTALDAAKIFRENQMTPADVESVFKVSLKGAIARDGTNLAKLAPSIFTEVIQGDLPIERAAMIGELLPNHPDQLAALDLIRRAESKGKRPTNEAIRELIAFVSDAPKKAAAEDANFNLFGDMMGDAAEESAALEMAELSAHIRKRLTGEKRLFGVVADAGKAKVLEAAGNRMGEQNAQLADTAARDLAIYDKLKASAGPINGLLRSGAESLGNGARPHDIREFTFNGIRAQINKLLKTEPRGAGTDSGRP